MEKSILQKQNMSGVLSGSSILHATHNGKGKPRLEFALNLTALIDAFSILVIFLLANMSSSNQALNVNAKTKLPEAHSSQNLNPGVVIRVDGNKYYLEEEEIQLGQLVARLVKIRQDSNDLKTDFEKESRQALIIQADRELPYSVVSPLLKAGGHAGFNHYRLAVLPHSNSKE